MRVVATAAALIILPLLHVVIGNDDRSLTEIESQIGNAETQVSSSDSNTIGALKEKLLLAETTISALTATVAELGNSAEASRRELEETKLKLESLDNSSNLSNSTSLEAKLIQCLKELRITKKNSDYAKSHLISLSEAIQLFMQTAGDSNPQSRLAVETELRNAAHFLDYKDNAPADTTNDLENSKVIDLKDDISLVVINRGKLHGIQVGMPFKVVRNSNEIGSLIIVDVREKISGGVIQSLSSESVRIEKGDSLKVDTKHN